MAGNTISSATAETVQGRATISVREAGQVLGISEQSAYNAARRGDIPTLKLGRRLLVPTAKLLALVN